MDRELRTQARLSKRTLTTQADIGNTVYGTEVHSVNGKAGHVVLNAEDVGALPSDTPIPSLDGYATEEWVEGKKYITAEDIPPEKFLFVNMTNSGSGFVTDYTYAEIRQAIDDGMYPIIVDATGKSTLYPLTYKTATGLMFSTTQGTANWTIQMTSSVLAKITTNLARNTDIPTVPTDVSAFNNDAGYLSNTLYPVVITQVSEDDDTRYTADKTFTEVQDAYNAGMIPVIVWKSAFIYVNAVTNSVINFTKVSGSSFYQFNYYSDRDVIVRSKISLAKTSDIPVVPTNVSAFNNDAGYLSDAYFIVGIEMDSNNNYYADCTFAEALAEYKSGKTLLAKFGGAVFGFSGIYDNETTLNFYTIFSSGRWVQHLTFRSTEAVTSILYKIPSKTSDLVNDSGFLTQHQDLSDYALKSELPTVPTDVSAFTNDAGYLSDAYYIVTISYSNGAYVADRTYDECLNAYNSGKLLFATDATGGFYPLTTNYGNALYFTGGSASNQRTFKFAKNGNNVTVTDTRLAKYNELPTVPTNVSDLNNDAGYLSDACFVITATADDDTSTVYTPDCTLAEAWSAFQSGKILLLKLGSTYIPSGFTSSALIRFSTFNGTYNRDYTFNNTRKIEKTSETKVLSEAYYIITLSVENGNYVPDHTFAEAVTAYQSGKQLVLKNGNDVVQMSSIAPTESGYINFAKVTNNTYTRFQLLYDNQVSRTNLLLARQDAIPTAVSQLTNDSGFLTQHQDLSAYALKSTVYTKTEVDTSLSTKADIADVPTKTSDLTNDSGFLTSHQDISGKADKSEIPTKVSDLTNDAGYLTQHQSLSGYATEAWVRQQGYLTQHQSLANYALKSEIPTVTNDFTDAYKGKVDSLWDDYQDALVALG